jgi:hypothetical protein
MVGVAGMTDDKLQTTDRISGSEIPIAPRTQKKAKKNLTQKRREVTIPFGEHANTLRTALARRTNPSERQKNPASYQ